MTYTKEQLRALWAAWDSQLLTAAALLAVVPRQELFADEDEATDADNEAMRRAAENAIALRHELMSILMDDMHAADPMEQEEYEEARAKEAKEKK